MTLAIQTPGGGPDVTRRNKRDLLYLKGDDSTDGSIRFSVDTNDNIGVVELRTGGSWNKTTFRVSGDSIELGLDLKLEAAADFIKTQNPSGFDDHDIALIPHIPFTPFGTLSPHIPIADTLKLETFFSSPVSQITATTISQTYSIPFAQIIKAITFQAGTLSASDEVVLKIHEGLDNTGVLISETNLPASKFLANNPVLVDFNSDIGFSETHVNIFIEMTSINSFSLETDVGGNIITDFLTQRLETRDLLYENLTLSNELDLTFSNELELTFHNQFPTTP